MIIQELDGTQHDITNYGLGLEDYSIPTLDIQHTTVDIPGRAPVILESSLGGRSIMAVFAFKSADWHDVELHREQIYTLFTRTDAYYIIFKEQPYKRFLVKTEAAFNLNKELDIVGNFTVGFLCVQPLAESVGTCRDLVNRDFDSGLWGWGSGVDSDIEYAYTFSDTHFTVHNIGTAPVDPVEGHDLRIVVKGIFPNGFSFTNIKTAQTYRYTAPVASGDVIFIHGMRTFKNGVSAFKDALTSDVISLAAGANDFIFYEQGGSLESITFDFRFYYK